MDIIHTYLSALNDPGKPLQTARREHQSLATGDLQAYCAAIRNLSVAATHAAIDICRIKTLVITGKLQYKTTDV